MKRILSFITGVCILLAGGLSVGCAKTVPNDENTLEIYCLDKGYGVEWCKDLIELFKQQDWVKQKYPELNVAFSSNDVSSFGESKLRAGARNNTIDLMFSILSKTSYAGKNSQGEETLVNLTESVYQKEVPGENILFEDKVFDSYNISNQYASAETSGEPQYYFVSWASGMNGILYNEDILNSLGISVPNTTQELIDACEKIMDLKDNKEGLYDKGYSFIQSHDDYWANLFPIWWAQYEGIDGYYDFYNGIYENRLSSMIFTQQGRVESLKVFESILDYDKGWYNPSSQRFDFMTAQTMFLQGNGVFHVNGDWFDNEMRKTAEALKEEEGLDYSIKMMRTPIVSGIISELDSVEDDKELSALISAIDAANPSLSGDGYDVSSNDYNRVKEARAIVGTLGVNHTAYIPSYATAKNIAIDFLRFMGTDVAINSYMKSTGGADLPFIYDVTEKDPALYEQLSDFQKSRIDYFNQFEIEVLPSSTGFPLAVYGGVGAFINTDYTTVFAASGNTKTPQDFYNETLSYWTESRWTTAISQAGLG